jgi:adenylate cyclase
MMVDSGIVREQLERIMASGHFARTRRLGRLLRFVVEQTIAGRTADLKEYSIAIAVFDKPDTFDPRLDAIVRVQARALRIRLDAYYRTDGRDDEVVIRCHAGTYVPRIGDRRCVPEPHAQTAFWSSRLDALQSFLAGTAAP